MANADLGVLLRAKRVVACFRHVTPQRRVPCHTTTLLAQPSEQTMAIEVKRADTRADTWPILQWVLGRLVYTARKAIRLQNRAAAMRKLTMTDELTGLYNRRGFLAMARQQLRLGARHGRCMSLFVVDVDRLKAINDALGHDAGDEVLKRVAAVLSSTFRKSDVVARHGGDEFVVLAVDAAQTNQRAIAARFEQGIELHNRRSGVVRISMSIGGVRFEPRGTRRIEDLIRRADSRMYSHKQARRGHVPQAG